MRNIIFTGLLTSLFLGFAVGQADFEITQSACSSKIMQANQSFVKQPSGLLPNMEYCGESSGGGG